MSETYRTFIDHVEHLQSEADNSCELYPEHQTIFPNDQLYMMRVSSLSGFSKIVDELSEKSEKPVGVVLKKSIEPNLDKVCGAYPYIDSAVKELIKKFGRD